MPVRWRIEMTISDKFTSLEERFFLISGNAVFMLAFCVLLTTDQRSFRNVSNLRLFAFDLLILAVLCMGYFVSRKKGEHRWKHSYILLAGGYLLLFLLQCLYVHFTCFYTGWDVGLMQMRVEAVLSGHTMQEVSGDIGYSVCPNNLFLFYIQYLIAKTGKLLSMKRPYDLCIYLSCLCVNLSCFLGSLVVRKAFPGHFIRFLYTVASTVFILFSPWIVIPYSDTYGMLFATLGIWAVCYLQKPLFRWPVLAFSSLIGYYIKPTCIFPLFAAFILFVPGFLICIREKRRELCILLISCVLFTGIGLSISPWIQHSLSFRIDPELKQPPYHFMMMGLNENSKGGFYGDDYFFTNSIPTYDEKVRMIKEEIGLRWNRMTARQKITHFTAKFLLCFNDGTFAWNTLRKSGLSEQDNKLNDLYLEIFHPEGKYFTLYYDIAQAMWLLILSGILFLFLNLNDRTSDKAFLIIILCGLFLFLMLFEAGGRYLFLYAPAFLLLSLYGYEGLFFKICKKIKKSC